MDGLNICYHFLAFLIFSVAIFRILVPAFLIVVRDFDLVDVFSFSLDDFSILKDDEWFGGLNIYTLPFSSPAFLLLDFFMNQDWWCFMIQWFSSLMGGQFCCKGLNRRFLWPFFCVDFCFLNFFLLRSGRFDTWRKS